MRYADIIISTFKIWTSRCPILYLLPFCHTIKKSSYSEPLLSSLFDLIERRVSSSSSTFHKAMEYPSYSFLLISGILWSYSYFYFKNSSFSHLENLKIIILIIKFLMNKWKLTLHLEQQSCQSIRLPYNRIE